MKTSRLHVVGALLLAVVAAALAPAQSRLKSDRFIEVPTAPDEERARGAAARFVPLNMEFRSASDQQRFNLPEVPIVHRRDRWALALLSMHPPAELDATFNKLDAALQDPNNAYGLIHAETDGPVEVPPLPPGDIERLRGAGHRIASGGVDGLTGAGVVIVIVDTGLDFRHEDFRTLDESGREVSRLMYLWDTTEARSKSQTIGAAPVSYPGGGSIGTVYTREQLTAELRERPSPPRVLAQDRHGHGTACAGIAAGNGARSNGEFAGVAPKADLIGVRVSVEGKSFPNTYLLPAICEWVENVCEGRPFIISCSFGGQYGGRDGMQLSERFLDAHFPADGVGRAICIAAGNEGDLPLHAGGTLQAGERRTISWGAGKTEGDCWVFPATGDASAYQLVSSMSARAAGGRRSPHTNHLEHAFQLNAEAGRIEIVNKSTAPLAFDAYIAFGSEDQPQRGFDSGVASPGRQIASPAAALAAITVGAYDFRGDKDGCGAALVIGTLSCYSNPGPLRFGDVIKPDIVAPGQAHAACATNDAAQREFSGYRYADGTSSATPYVAGLIALMLEKNPTLKTGEIRALLHKHATADEFTGPVPNPGWGYGKLDLAAVQRILAAVPPKP